MQREFSVAGHIFRVIIPDESPLWGLMGQYDPFAVKNNNGAIFELNVVNELDEGERVLYYDQPTEPGETKIVIYKSGVNWLFESSPTSDMKVSMRLWMNESFTHSMLQILDETQSLFALNNALMLQYAFRTSGLATLEMHASVIENGGKAYLFLAKSGTGKSTHSRMWLKNIPGSHLLNDDNPIVRVLSDGTVMVYGSPWSGKTSCYHNESYPLGAMVEIRRTLYDKITPLGTVSAYALVYSSTSGIKFDAKMADDLHTTLCEVVKKVHCFTLECLPDAQAALVCYNGVKG